VSKLGKKLKDLVDRAKELLTPTPVPVPVPIPVKR
jgi:hypothetical protein